MNRDFKLCFLKAVALCFKPWLKPDEAMIYCNLNRTQFLKRCAGFGIQKNKSGYYDREQLDKMLSGAYITLSERWDDLLNGDGNNNVKK